MLDRRSEHVETLEPRRLLTVAFDSAWAVLPALAPALQGVSALVADMNNDGRDDVVLAWDNPTRMLAVHLGSASGVFTPVSAIFTGTPNSVRALGDFDGDGDVDAIVDSSLFLTLGGGVLLQSPVDPLLAVTSTMSVLDIDGDGQSEIATKDGTVLRIIRLQSGAFVQTATLTVGEVFSLDGDASVVDLNGNGRPDLALRTPNPTPQTQLVFNDAGVLRLGPVLVGEATLADGTGDGIADWFTVSSRADTSLDIFVASGVGDGTFGSAVLRDTLRPGWSSPTLRTLVPDVNGDGQPDLLVTQVIALQFSSTEVVLSNAQGRYVSGSSASGMGITSGQTGSRVRGTGDFDGDGRLDLWGISFSFGIDQRVTISRQMAGATVTGFTASAAVLRPLETLVLTATVDRGDLTNPPFVEFYFDNDRDGRLSTADTLIGNVGTPGNDGAYRLAYVRADTDPVGQVAMIAVARSGAVSPAMSTQVTLWGRIFYPEGFRNDASINEYLSIVNPNGRAVEYQIIARYETGERDQVIATGTIAANSRGGATIVERGRPESGLTRSGVGYALELQADGELGATFAHYDTFATGPDARSGGGEGEALNAISAREWSFADVSTATFDFLLFFNPTASDTIVQVRFYDGDLPVIRQDVTVASLRRGGLALRDMGQLAAGRQYAVTLTSSAAISAVHSRYRQDGSAWGVSAIGRADEQIMAGIEVRPSAVSTLTLYNTHTESIQVTIETSFDVGLSQTSLITVLSRQRINLDPLAGAPAGAAVASLRFTGLLPAESETGEVLIALSTEDSARNDIIAGAAASAGAPVWAFGDAFLSNATAGVFEFETLVVYNPTDADQDVTLRYFFTNGESAQRVLTVPARRPAKVKLEEERDIVDHAPNNWYGITVTGTGALVASLTHWDISQAGGWVTLGTPLSASVTPGIGD